MNNYPRLTKTVIILAILVLIVVILVYARPFLIPLTFAALLAMLLLPLTKWLKDKGIHEVVAIVLSILLLVGFFALIFFLISLQISDLAKNTSQIEKQVTERYHQVQQLITDQLGISPAKQEKMIKEQQASSPGKLASLVTGFLAGLGDVLTDTILVLVYIFLLICFRSRLKGFIVRLVPKKEEPKALEIVNNVQQVTQKYLSGLSLMVVSLWVMYGIGFTVVGVKNALFFAILCGILEIIPFVGNLTGTTLTIVMSLVQGGNTNTIVGVLITYGLVQFIQSYILEPLIVGSAVNINPLFTIVGLVAGEMVWGIPGMILAIPLLGITKIVCDHIEPLQPYAYLIGEEKKKENGIKKFLNKTGRTIKGWFQKK
ncbi:AI-2E family transporter [Cytophagaceae bacterium YF14B1]|uniref:AI-2E family transporter n=1 Tax=Xanthocytophaga flava TaxID=3048013 RepID=A0AAE3QTX1_9BACT|nr:AI-2E family transporter [Xanthocytophaga flavus]MDJ1485385.1 AI-2E family transporter [Xanthocytophaga flavus]